MLSLLFWIMVPMSRPRRMYSLAFAGLLGTSLSCDIGTPTTSADAGSCSAQLTPPCSNPYELPDVSFSLLQDGEALSGHVETTCSVSTTQSTGSSQLVD